MSQVRLQGIRKEFGDLVALDDVSFDVPDGSFFVLVGPSGAGKTTTLRIIAGLVPPTTGDVYFGATPVRKVTPSERDVAMVFQSYALYPKKSAFDNIASPLNARHLPADEIRTRVHAVAEVLHIDHLLDRKPGAMSGGEQQRVALGRALVREPRAFLMDEPLTNLDVKLRFEMRAELTRLHRQVGKTFLYVTNDQVEAMSMADQIAVLHEGRIQQVGTPADVYDAPRNRFVATFIGSTRMNLLDCDAVDGVLVGDTGWKLAAPGGRRAPSGRRLQLGVRPEDLRLEGPVDGAGLEGTVYAVEPLGDRSLVDIEVGESVVRVKGPPSVDYAVGERIRVGVDLERAHLFDAETGDAVGRQAAVASTVPSGA